MRHGFVPALRAEAVVDKVPAARLAWTVAAEVEAVWIAAEKADHGVELADAVLERRAAEAPAKVALQLKGAACRVRRALFDVVRLVKDHAAPHNLVQQAGLVHAPPAPHDAVLRPPKRALEHGIRRQHNVGLRERGLVLRALRTVPHDDVEAFGKLDHFVAPLQDRHGRRDDEARALGIGDEQTDHLDCLAHTHLVRKHAAAPRAALLCLQPKQALALERQ